MRILFLLLFFCVANSISAQERFTDWQTTIVPVPDRSIEVTERITVVSTGEEIKRGITRSLPDASGHQLEILSLARDGQTSPYHTRHRGSQTTIYAGTEDQLLSPGTYTYELRYTIAQAVGEDERLDELQFEVIGPGVEFPVERAAATLIMPSGLTVAQSACYTGADGATASDCTLTKPDSGRLSFTSTLALGQGRQLSVAAGFEPGFFAPATAPVPPPEPTWFQREGTLLLWLLLAIAGGYYAVVTWRRHGVDPPTPRVGTVHVPPGGISPASAGHLLDTFGQYTSRQFTASIMGLATLGYLTIEPDEEKGFLSTRHFYRLTAVRPAPDLASLPGEQRLVYRRLFDGRDSFSVEGKYDEELHELFKDHHEMVKEHHSELRGKGANLRFVWPLLGLYLASVPFSLIWAKHAGAGFALAIVTFYLIAGLFGVFVYGWLIRRPDEKLVRLRTEIAALKEYLDLPEEARKRLLNVPRMSREHYEELLPYAVALGINETWSGYVQDMVSRDGYHPVWMVGAPNFVAGDFDKNFRSAVGTSSTPVNASSASGGGGSVGGGVGGGGAGGW